MAKEKFYGVARYKSGPNLGTDHKVGPARDEFKTAADDSKKMADAILADRTDSPAFYTMHFGVANEQGKMVGPDGNPFEFDPGSKNFKELLKAS